MPNITLPTSNTPNSTPLATNLDIAWPELMRLSKDTGQRDVTSLLVNGWTASKVLWRRIVDEVFLEFRDLNGSAATNATFMNFSGTTGFTPPSGTVTESELWRSSTGGTGFVRASSSALTSSVGFTFPATTSHTMRYFTASTYPTTLPGIAG